MKFKNRIHLIGIGGAGMAGIAEFLVKEGYTVTGSDLAHNKMTKRLKDMGVPISIGHDGKHLHQTQQVVYSSAIQHDNPELKKARQRKIPTARRGEFLAKLLQGYYGIAITGTHGKTTTTSLVSSLLLNAQLDPSFIVGGFMFEVNSHAHYGNGPYFVVEADESDASFLYLHPQIAVITNIDCDHMQTFEYDLTKLKAAFLKFTDQVSEDGAVIICHDDPLCRQLLPRIKRPVLSYGFHSEASIRAINLKETGASCHFDLKFPNKTVQSMQTMNLPGRHNVLNALAVSAVAYHLEVDIEALQHTLMHFGGVGRRFQKLGYLKLANQKKALVIDDYAHHPQEIRAVLGAARQIWPDRRLIAVFQPHRFTRTQELWSDFAKCWDNADLAVLVDIYSAGESPIQNITSAKLAEIVRHHHHNVHYFDSNVDIKTRLAHFAQEDDIIIMLGAGSIGKMAQSLIDDASELGKISA